MLRSRSVFGGTLLVARRDPADLKSGQLSRVANRGVGVAGKGSFCALVIASVAISAVVAQPAAARPRDGQS
jgi:hypothetical protein